MIQKKSSARLFLLDSGFVSLFSLIWLFFDFCKSLPHINRQKTEKKEKGQFLPHLYSTEENLRKRKKKKKRNLNNTLFSCWVSVSVIFRYASLSLSLFLLSVAAIVALPAQWQLPGVYHHLLLPLLSPFPSVTFSLFSFFLSLPLSLPQSSSFSSLSLSLSLSLILFPVDPLLIIRSVTDPSFLLTSSILLLAFLDYLALLPATSSSVGLRSSRL